MQRMYVLIICYKFLDLGSIKCILDLIKLTVIGSIVEFKNVDEEHDGAMLGRSYVLEICERK